MNILDVTILVVLALFALAGYYKGFLTTVASIAAFLVSCIFGLLLMGGGAGIVKSDESLFNMLLYYTEGSEYVSDVELARTNISALSSAQIKNVIADANLPYPFDKEITENITKQSFEKMDITTLGDYFNQTIVCVVINILVFLVVFLIVRGLLAFFINGADYTLRLPKLQKWDGYIAAGFGFLRGLFAMSIVCMLIPMILIVLDFEFVHTLIDESLLVTFFYRVNLLLAIMPGM